MKNHKELSKADLAQMKIQYDSFRDSGELQIFFPESTGEWVEDLEVFSAYWLENKKIITDSELGGIEFI